MTRILIVDDNPRVRSALRVCLQMHRSWEVCSEAENGQDGVELAKQLKPDIVLIDYAMPDHERLGSRPTHLGIDAAMWTDPVHDVCLP